MNMPKHCARTAATLAAALATLFAAPGAQAVPIGTTYSFALDVAQSQAGLPGSYFGMVTLTQGQDEVGVDVRLADGFLFANTGIGAQFAFKLALPFTDVRVTLDAASAANFAVAAGSGYNMTPYGVFTDALVFKPGTPTGLSARIGTPLSFSVAQSGISLDAFTTSGARNSGQPGGYSFAADIGYAPTGKTGGVGAIDHTTTLPPKDDGGSSQDGDPLPPAEVPEPMSLVLLGLGMGGIALSRRRG